MTINIDYIEFATTDMTASKQFFTEVFGWQFVDYGPDYAAFEKQGLDGGFYKAESVSASHQGAPLVVLMSEQLESLIIKIEQAGGKITKPIFSFPGGERFQFSEPGGNELAVWRKV